LPMAQLFMLRRPQAIVAALEPPATRKEGKGAKKEKKCVIL
jgi:cell division control protein 42